MMTGVAAQHAALGLFTGTNANFGTNCTNCFAVPRSTGTNFNPINGGVGPTAPFSGSTLNWAAFNTAANSGSNGARNIFNPYTIGWDGSTEPSNPHLTTPRQ